MKYVIFVYNMSTLCRAIQYIDSQWGKENSTILYADLVSEIPSVIMKDYEISTINTNSLDTRCKGMSLLIGSCCSAISAWKKLDSIIKTTNELITFVVFRDNEIQEATMIKKATKKYSDKIRIWLIEEGSGIYAVKRIPPRYLIIKTITHLFFGASTYSLKSIPQGMNENIEKIICTHPELLRDKFKNSNVIIEKMIPVFTHELSKYITESILGECGVYTKYDYVFLTQPITDFPKDYESLLVTHQELLPQVFDILSKNGSTIIKLHPRENYDYSVFIGEEISLSKQEEKQIPFECLMQLYGNPQMISMFSSTSMTISTDKPSIYLCELFKIPGTDHLYSSDHYSNNNIIICNTLEGFSKALVKKN